VSFGGILKERSEIVGRTVGREEGGGGYTFRDGKTATATRVVSIGLCQKRP
jgi:hypothetical protein